MSGKNYPTGFDSGFATDADYEDGFIVSDATIGQVAMNRGISTDKARKMLTGMDRLNQRLSKMDAHEDGPDGPENDIGYGGY